MSQHFTLEEANDCIPTLEVILRKLNDLVGAMRNQYLKEIARFASLIHEVNSHGCILKDVSQGLVDFPHMKDGREVYLCWMMGEKSIGWWHERDSGFSGRQPIETL
jgi:hypothetical protein